MNSLKLATWAKSNGYTLPTTIVARIVGYHPHHFNVLWRTEEGRERVKEYFDHAERKFNSICDYVG